MQQVPTRPAHDSACEQLKSEKRIHLQCVRWSVLSEREGDIDWCWRVKENTIDTRAQTPLEGKAGFRKGARYCKAANKNVRTHRGAILVDDVSVFLSHLVMSNLT